MCIYNKAVLEPQVSPAFAITYFCNIVIWDLTHTKLEPKVIDPRWPLTPSLLRSHVWHYPRIIKSKSHENTSKYVDTVTFFSKPWTKGHWPLDDLWPQVCLGHMCVSTQGSLCPSLMKIHHSVWIQWPSFQKLKPKVIDPWWPLTSCLLRSHVCLYPRITVSKSHGNTSMYVDTMISFAKYHILHTY